jgi:UDP-N-acetyl-D-mannosaminuronate dehydrogenase
MCKPTKNSVRGVNIIYARALVMVGDRNGGGVLELRKLANHHWREDILQPRTVVFGYWITVNP